MRSFRLLLVSLSLFAAAPVFADEVTYRGSMTGLECAGCKKAIAKSLGKLEGVQTIRIVRTSEKAHTLTLVTDGSHAISKAEAVKALGKKAPHYQITSWSRAR